MSEIYCDIVADSAHTQRVRTAADNSRVFKSTHDSQLLPLPASSPLRDDMFIDDMSDVELSDRYVM